MNLTMTYGAYIKKGNPIPAPRGFLWGFRRTEMVNHPNRNRRYQSLKEKMMTIMGKFVLIEDNDTYSVGQIIEAVTPEIYLVRFEHEPGCKSPAERPLYVKMIEDRWQLFDTLEDLERWVNWLETSEPKQSAKISMHH
jgi:hypothetical protein